MAMHVTLNLLPPANKTALRTGFIFAYAQSMLVLVLAVIALVAGTLLAVRAQVLSVHADYAARATGPSREYDTLVSETKAVNTYLKRLESLRVSSVQWSSVLRAITETVPTGVRLTGIRANASGLISVSGVAETRDDVLAMREQLEDSPMFEKVQSPLSNILERRDVKFDFEMRYLPQ
jgi:Tfp pilus assembly protein PilN